MRLRCCSLLYTVVARSRKWGEEEKRRGCKYLFKGAEGNKRGKGERERESKEERIGVGVESERRGGRRRWEEASEKAIHPN